MLSNPTQPNLRPGPVPPDYPVPNPVSRCRSMAFPPCPRQPYPDFRSLPSTTIPAFPASSSFARSELVLASPSSYVPASLLRLPESQPSSNVDKGSWVTSVAGRRRPGRRGNDMAGSAFGHCTNSPRPRYTLGCFSFSAVIHREQHSSLRRMRAGWDTPLSNGFAEWRAGTYAGSHTYPLNTHLRHQPSHLPDTQAQIQAQTQAQASPDSKHPNP